MLGGLLDLGVQACVVVLKLFRLLFLCKVGLKKKKKKDPQSKTLESSWFLSGRNILLLRALPLRSCENSQHLKLLSIKQGSFQVCWIRVRVRWAWISYSGSELTDGARGNQGDAF